ncbi:MAG: GGDEF domain-containing protein [Roseateles depolymerans]|uniref:diguanylate cyclase n=1 Tax=Roseateles depolymerans TaxID=76731 RepID=A0A2W5FCD3_9BURK|nr:MAG: GGDEF domain-containing protein [Roseateles depolymerans]
MHVPTLLLLLVMGFGLLTVQLAVAQRGQLHQGELVLVGLGSASLCAGFIAFGLQAWSAHWLTALLGNLLIVSGIGCFAAAVYRFTLNRDLPQAYRVLLCLGAVPVVVVLALGSPWRVAVLSLTAAVMLAPAVLVALRHGWRSEKSFRVAGLLLLTALIASLARAAQVLQDPSGHDASSWDTVGGPTLWLALTYTSLMGAGFGLVLACFERMSSQLRELASVDGLTGCWNHNTTVSLLAHSLERGRREGQPVGFVMLDLDHFKAVNDRHGHAGGDRVLRAFAACVRERLRGSDVLGRLGGEEFGLVLPATGASGARHLADQIRLAIEALQVVGEDGEPMRVTVSAGVAVAEPSRGDTAEALMRLADKALYQAKQQGRNRVVVADDWMRNSTLQAVLA